MRAIFPQFKCCVLLVAVAVGAPVSKAIVQPTDASPVAFLDGAHRLTRPSDSTCSAKPDGEPAFDGSYRIALIIANKDYPLSGLASLPGVESDVQNMQPALRRTGFSSIETVVNATRNEMVDAINRFAERVCRGGSRAIGLIYFSGHGAVETNYGVVYLVPSDAHLSNDALVADSALADEDILDTLLPGSPARMVFILDACRTTIQLIQTSSRQRVDAVTNRQSDEHSAAGSKQILERQMRTLSRSPLGDPNDSDPPQYTRVYATSPGFAASDSGVVSKAIASSITVEGANSSTAFLEAGQSINTVLKQVPHIDQGITQPFEFTQTRQEKMVTVKDVVMKTDWRNSVDRDRGRSRIAELLGSTSARVRSSSELMDLICSPEVADAARQILETYAGACRLAHN